MEQYNEIIERIHKENEDVEAIKKYANEEHNVFFNLYMFFIQDESYIRDEFKKNILNQYDDNNHEWNDNNEQELQSIMETARRKTPEILLNDGKIIVSFAAAYQRDGRGNQDENIDRFINKNKNSVSGDYLFSRVLISDKTNTFDLIDDEINKIADEKDKIAKYFE